MTDFVAGFLFDTHRSSVLLVRKERPEWQKGKYNGIGGKVELGENPLEAMIREFREETGLSVLGWKRFCVLHGDDWIVYFFYTFEDYDFMNNAKGQDGEELGLLKIEAVKAFPRIPNLDWLIPMALGMESDKATEFDIMEIK